MHIDRTVFYNSVRGSLFGGSFNDKQFDGMQAILDAWEHHELNDIRWLAYMMATAYHETAITMQPIEEYGRGRGREYGRPDPTTGKAYYGRGFVQLTWADNYRRMGQVLNLPLLEHPELALQMPIAVSILFHGMINGSFTGKGLKDYFSITADDPVNARRIVNGTDKATIIAGYHGRFLQALHKATASPVDAPEPEMIPPSIEVPDPAPRPTVGPAAAIAAALAALVALVYSGWEYIIGFWPWLAGLN